MSETVTDTMPVGVVIERREINNQWQQCVHTPVAVIPGAPPMAVTEPWKLLNQGDGWAHFHAGTLKIEINSKSTSSYRNNLMNEMPFVFVVLQPGEEADEPDVVTRLVTVDPDEAADYLDTSVAVEGVPMPPELVAWVQDFVAKHHVEVKFEKRKRKPYDPRREGFRRRDPRDRSETGG